MLSGCGTLKTLSPADGHVEISYAGSKSYCQTIPRIYSGTFFEVCKLYGEPSYRENIIPGLPLFMLDIPLSFIADTLVIPYTIMRQHEDGNIFVN